jgi:hypothetical protein
MLCPVCTVEMIVLEFDRIELDTCLECRGVWLDSGELEMIGERAGAVRHDLLAALVLGPGAGSTGQRRCPVCRKKMAHVHAPGDSPVTIDRCPDEHGLWFDHEELHAVVVAAGADGNNPLARFFADLADGPEAHPSAGQPT